MMTCWKQQLQYCRLAAILALLLCSSCSTAQLPLRLRLRRAARSNIITLTCLRTSDNRPITEPQYVIKPPGSSGRLEILNNTTFPLNEDDGSVMFQLVPQMEGGFLCRNRTSREESNIIQLAAYPTARMNIAEVTSAAVQRGGSLTLECEFEKGRAAYTYQWFRGSEAIYRTGGFTAVGFLVLDDASLVIENADFEDESLEYRCRVSVANPPGNPFNAIGRSIRVEVFDDATIITGIETTPLVVREREQPQFTCIAEGRPTPNMAWFFNGVEAHSGDSSGQFVIRNETRGTRIMSTFSVVQSFAQHSGIVSCEAWNRPETVNVTFNDASSTTLTVLTNDIDDLLLTTSMQPQVLFLDFKLPARIHVPVSVEALYMEEDSTQVYPAKFPDKMFNETLSVHFQIPAASLPPFDAFRIKIALSTGNTQGAFTGASNRITVGSPEDDSDNTLVVVVTVCVPTAGVVMVITVISIVGGFCYCSHNKSKQFSRSNSAQSDGGDEEADSPFIPPWQALFGEKEEKSLLFSDEAVSERTGLLESRPPLQQNHYEEISEIARGHKAINMDGMTTMENGRGMSCPNGNGTVGFQTQTSIRMMSYCESDLPKNFSQRLSESEA